MSSIIDRSEGVVEHRPRGQEKRVCQIIKLKPEYVEEYKALHAPGGTWPGVLAALQRHHITQYSIHYYPPIKLLIANFVYTGSDWEADTAGIAADPETQRWWKVTDAMQESFTPGATGSAGELPWWTDLERVFWFDGENGQPK